MQRYALKAALGLAAAHDDDARSVSDPGPISSEQVQELADEIEREGIDPKKFCEYFKVDRIADLRADQYDRAKSAIRKAMENKKKGDKS